MKRLFLIAVLAFASFAVVAAPIASIAATAPVDTEKIAVPLAPIRDVAPEVKRTDSAVVYVVDRSSGAVKVPDRMGRLEYLKAGEPEAIPWRFKRL